jgi:AcrR family transcriptional regulator
MQDMPATARSRRPSSGTLPALQRRSRDKRDRLLEAGMKVFGTLGYEAARVADIADAAGISVGVFYQRFRDKRALFAALEDEFVGRSADRIAAFFAAADPSWSAIQLFERLLGRIARVMRQHVGFFRGLVTLAHRDRDVLAPGLALDRHNAVLLHRFLDEQRLIPRTITEQDVLFGLASVSNVMLVHTLLRRDASAVDRRLTRELARMLARYLGIVS